MKRTLGGILVGILGFILPLMLVAFVWFTACPYVLSSAECSGEFSGLVPGVMGMILGAIGAFVGPRIFLRYYDKRK